jgi:hypothetical protein
VRVRYTTWREWRQIQDTAWNDARFAPIVHNHNDLYYTEAETDTLLNGKANSIHNHVLADITNMTPFMRTVNDDASAADARATLEASPLNTTLSDSAGSSALPTIASGTLVSKIQSLRNNVKQIFADLATQITAINDKVSKSDTTLQPVASALSVQNAHIGNWSGGVNYARFGHVSQNGGNFGILQDDIGRVFVRSSTLTNIGTVNAPVAISIASDGAVTISNVPLPADDSTRPAPTSWVRDYASKAPNAIQNISSSQTVTPVNGLVYYIDGVYTLTLNNTPVVGTTCYVQVKGTCPQSSRVNFSDVAGNSCSIGFDAMSADGAGGAMFTRIGGGWLSVGGCM